MACQAKLASPSSANTASGARQRRCGSRSNGAPRCAISSSGSATSQAATKLHGKVDAKKQATRPITQASTSSASGAPCASSMPAQLGNAVSTVPAMSAKAKPKIISCPCHSPASAGGAARTKSMPSSAISTTA